MKLISICLSTLVLFSSQGWYYSKVESGAGSRVETDDFNRSDEELAVSSNWSINYTESGNDNNVSSNTLIGENGNYNSDYWSAGAAWSNDHYSQLVANSDNNDGGPSVRANSGDDYFLDNDLSAMTIFQYNGGSFDVVASTTKDFSASSVYRLEVSNTTLTSKEDGSTTGMPSGTDASISSGSPGVFIFGNTLVFDDWEGGDL